MELMERQPDGWQIVRGNAAGDMILFCYGVKPEETHRLPVGAHYGVVYSPSPFVDQHSPLWGWCYVVFEVRMTQYRIGEALARSYAQIKRRKLTRFEIPHFEDQWFEIELKMRRANVSDKPASGG